MRCSPLSIRCYMSIKKLLIANRGEIAIRIARACAELGIISVAIFPKDDQYSLHTRKTDASNELIGTGGKAYLDGKQTLTLGKHQASDSLHQWYGLLTDNADFAHT